MTEGKPARQYYSDNLDNFFKVVNSDQEIKATKSMLLAMRLDLAIKSKNLNKGAFAKLMGVQPSVISKWLSAEHNFTIDTLFKIEKVLEIQIIKTK